MCLKAPAEPICRRFRLRSDQTSVVSEGSSLCLRDAPERRQP